MGTVNINVGFEISSVKTAASHSLTYKDENGTIATLSLNRGVADVYFDGIGTFGGTTKKGVTTVGGTGPSAP